MTNVARVILYRQKQNNYARTAMAPGDYNDLMWSSRFTVRSSFVYGDRFVISCERQPTVRHHNRQA